MGRKHRHKRKPAARARPGPYAFVAGSAWKPGDPFCGYAQFGPDIYWHARFVMRAISDAVRERPALKLKALP